MPFNWFQRTHTDSDQKTETSPDPETALDQEKSDQSSTTADESASGSDQTLDWAKLAYARIQARRQAAEAATSTAVSGEPATGDAAATTTATPTLATKSTPETIAAVDQEGSSAEQTATASQVATEMGAADDRPEVAQPIEDHDPNTTATTPSIAEASIAEADSSEAAQQTAPEPQIAETVSNSESKPFWAKAEAERSAKLERLSATVVETSTEPEQAADQPTPASDALADGMGSDGTIPTDLTFDEGFIWSAEVLAAQGRSAEDVSIEEITWLRRLRQGLDRTRRSLINQLKSIVGKGPLNDDAVLSIEEALLQADAGLAATDAVIEALQAQMRETVLPPDQAMAALKQILQDILDRPIAERGQQRFLAPEKDVLNVWLITGVNGAGKTTTIGKLAHIAQKSGYRCLIAAADTFRAAAVEQVKVWGQRSGIEVIANTAQNTDPAAVVYDAISAAKARNTELLLVDTAGRLQNKKNLMEELSKIRRIIDKQAENARIESLLVLDATLGQNGLRQAEVFRDVANLSGVVLTKLDGTAKGGVALAVAQQLDLPIHFIGVGEGIEDLRPFSSYEFVEALLSS